VVLGGSNASEGEYSVAIGRQSLSGAHGQVAISSGFFESRGDAQMGMYQLRAKTMDDTPSKLFLDGISRKMVVRPMCSCGFTVRLLAYNITDDMCSIWVFKGAVSRKSSGIYLSESMVTESWSEQDGLEAGVSADNSDKSLSVDVTGLAGRTVYWSAVVVTSETIGSDSGSGSVPVGFVEVSADSQIMSLSASVQGGQSMFPSFDASIQDYCVKASSVSGAQQYEVLVNGSPVAGTADVNRCIRVSHGMQEYFIRVIPSDLPLATVTEKQSGYVPGYYLCSVAPHYCVAYDENGVPFWYVAHPEQHGCSVHFGGDRNRILLNSDSDGDPANDTPRHLLELSEYFMADRQFSIKKDSRMLNTINPDRSISWDFHEGHAVAGPAGRKGNIMALAYLGTNTGDENGFYLQEQDPHGNVVKEWYSKDYFTLPGDQYHCNSIDVDPITGQVLLSLRTTSSVACIDWPTGQVLWVFSNSGNQSTYNSRVPGSTSGTKWLSPYGEPVVGGFQYTGPDGQHDCRWHSDILSNGNRTISIYDNQWYNSGLPRGVVYEIDLDNERAVFKSHVYRNDGQRPWQYTGSFTLVKEEDGSLSHVAYWATTNPCLVEYKGSSSDPSGNIVFSMSMPAAEFRFGFYRIVKVRGDMFDKAALRATSGLAVGTQSALLKQKVA
jgi:hypothetical protein